MKTFPSKLFLDGADMLSITVSDKAVGVVFLLDFVDRICDGVSYLKNTSDSFFLNDGCGEVYTKKCKIMSPQDAEGIISCSQSIIREVIRLNGSHILLMLVSEINKSEKQTNTDSLVIDILNKLSDMHSSLVRLIGSVRSNGNIVMKYKDFSLNDVFELSELLKSRFIALKKQINLQYKSDLFEVDVVNFMKKTSDHATINSFIDAAHKERLLKAVSEGDRAIVCNNIHNDGTVSFIVKGEESVKFFTQVTSKEFLSVREISCFDADGVDFCSRRVPLKVRFHDSFTHILMAMPILSAVVSD